MPDLALLIQHHVQAMIAIALRRAGISGASIDAANLTGLAPGGGTLLSIPQSAISGMINGHTIADEGTALTARGTLNFTGPGVRATDNGGASRTDVTVNRWEPLTNGVSATPEHVYAAGDVIMVERVS